MYSTTGTPLAKIVHSSSYYKTSNKLSSRAKDYSPSVMHRRELSRRPMGIQLRLQSRILHLGILRHLHRRGIILGPRRRRGTTRRVALVAAVAAVAIITLRWQACVGRIANGIRLIALSHPQDRPEHAEADPYYAGGHTDACLRADA